MSWVLAAFAYIVCHFLAYVVVFRRMPTFGTERTIFLYHFVSAVVVGLSFLFAVMAVRTPDALALATSAILAHALYSLTFLELWSLAEGGYSLTILRLIADAAACDSPVSGDALASIGSSKKQSRLEGLQRLRMVRYENGLFRLTGFGRLAADFAEAIARTVNMKQAA
jgi:hypothetical protein